MKVISGRRGGARVFFFALLFVCLSLPALTQTEDEQTAGQPAGMGQGQNQSEDFVLNYRNVDIRLFIESFSELTGKSFLIDPRIGGKVTIIGNATVPQDQIYDVMLSIFTMYGIRAVPAENGITRIVPANNASRYSPVGGTSDLITEIMPIINLDAPAVIPLIKPFMTPEAQIITHKPTNQLIITEVKTNLRHVKQILSRLDVPDVGEFEIINLQNMEAKEMVSIVQRAGNKYLKSLVQIVPDNKNERIIMTGPLTARLPLRTLIVEIDSSQNVVDPVSSIRVIPLEYAKVTDVEKIIKGVLSASNFLSIYGGEGAYTLDGEKQADAASEPAAAEGAEADDAKAEEGDASEATYDERVNQAKRNFTIQSDRATNSLIVGGPAHILTLVISLVKSLDVARPQVLIEAIIAELSSQQTQQLGAQIGVENAVPILNQRDFKSLIGAFAGDSFIFGYQGYVNTQRNDNNVKTANPVHILVQALETDANTRVLATPSIVTLNNEEAVINISEERSVLQSDVLDPNLNTGTRQSYQRTEFGTKLTVTPQVTAGNKVRLDIDQVNSNVISDGNTARPVSSKREVKTNVVVSDGSTLILGGLTENRQRETLNRVPLLSSVPLLGFLFRDRDDTSNKTNLMIFIKPTIINAPPDADEITETRYAELRLQQMRQLQTDAEQGIKIDSNYMLLPPFSELGIKLDSREERPNQTRSGNQRKPQSAGN